MNEDPNALVPVTATATEEPEPSSSIRAQVTAAPPEFNRIALLQQIGHGIPLSIRQKQKLLRQATDDIVSLLPTGEIYVEGKHWRDVMNDTFGPMQWGIVSVKEPVLELAPPDARGVKSMLFLEVFLIVKGKCVANAIGAQEYFPGSKRMTKDDALEGCRTNGLMRCLKQFGTFGNLWDSKWADPCRSRIGLKVRVKEGWPSIQWRRIDDEPLLHEQGLAPDSPNKDAYKPTPTTQRPPEARAEPVKPEPPKEQPEHRERNQMPVPPGKILVIRPVKFMDTRKNPPEPSQYWVVNTEHDEFITADPLVEQALQALKKRGARIEVTGYETVTNAKNLSRKHLLEYRVVES